MAVVNLANLGVPSVVGRLMGGVVPVKDAPLNPVPSGVSGGLSFSDKSADYVRLGYAPDLNDVPFPYRVSIYHTKPSLAMVVAVLQKPIRVFVESVWQPFVPLVGLTQAADVLAQAFAKRSLLVRFTTRRIWAGTSPLELSLDLKFVAYKDAWVEVVAPCLELQRMVLPGGGTGEWEKKGLPFLIPPGPSPFKANDVPGIGAFLNATVTGRWWAQRFAEGDEISINLGTFLSFSSVIISKVEVVYANKFTVEGYPVEAEVKVVFETYEIFTKEAITGSTSTKRVV